MTRSICKEALEAPDLADDDKYWILATFYEAYVGLGQEDEALDWRRKSEKIAKADWMNETTENQVAKLRELLSN